jgi:Collagen triple helix repeat (20 copies)
MPLFPPQDYRKTEFTHRVGLAADRPAAADVLVGTLYFSSDTLVLERSDGVVWSTYSPAGGGLPGPMGPQGYPGIDGIDGEDGINGINGAAGAQGIPGSTGPAGAQGTPGIPGIDGEDGLDGLPGPTGPSGPQGIQGIQGIQGLIGPPGLDGIDGEDGLSIVGPTGPSGPAGSSGAAGVQGPIGPPGIDAEEPEYPYIIPGERGPQGPAGGGGGGGLTLTPFTQDLGAARRSGTFDITGLAGLTVDKPVLVIQTKAPISSKGDARDEPEMDMIVADGYVLSTTSIRVDWFSAAGSVVVGIYAFAYAVSG